MSKLSDSLKAAMAQKHVANTPKARGTAEKSTKAKSVAGPKPVKKAAGRGR